MRESEFVADRHPVRAAQSNGVVRRFLAWAQRADAECRADAASALARAYLYSDLTAQARAEAALGLTALLDDPSATVRRALAEALASAADAPLAIVLALACDQSEVASVVLSRSPALTDAELVDCAATGDAVAQAAIAMRPQLSAGVAAALTEIGARNAVLALADNLAADLPAGVLWRIFKRFSGDAEVREALLARAWLPSGLRNELAAATARALADFVAGCDWLSRPRAERIAREAREQATVAIARASAGGELADLVARLRADGGLTVAVLMRALLCGERAFFIQAMVELSGMSLRRVAALALSPASHGFRALYAKAGLPAAFLPAFRAALEGAGLATGEHPSLPLAERAMEACGADPAAAQMCALLARLASEAAREDARAFVEDIALLEAPALLEPAAGGDAREPPQALSIAPPIDYAPLLIGAVAAALENDIAPPVEPLFDAAALGEDRAPPVQLPADMLAALAEAA